MKKRKTFLPQVTLALNFIFLLLQLFAMDSFGFGLEFPVLSLVVPLLCLINFIFFCFLDATIEMACSSFFDCLCLEL